MTDSTKGKGSDMPSPDVNPGNAIQRVEECMKYMSLQQWKKFNFLYPRLQKFQDVRIKGTGKMLQDDDEFTRAWNNLRANAVDVLIKNLESSQSFDEFLDWTVRLGDIVTDKRTLWNILHTEVQPSIKVTLEQSRQISAKFFPSNILFEYGFDSFLASGLCDFSQVTNEDEYIDIFYATVGFMRACNLDDNYQVKDGALAKLTEFSQKILLGYISIPDFDPNKFVWLIEVMNQNLHMPSESIKKICETVLKEFSEQNSTETSSLTRLQQICTISTSPLLQKIPLLKETLNKVFETTVLDQRKFVHRYIFGSFVNYVWEGEAQPNLSDPLVEWKLFIINLSARLEDRPELPKLLLSDIIANSLPYFVGYYGEVQPSIERSVNLRMDIFEIVNVCVKYHPGAISTETLKLIWYLLYIAAVSGAKDEDLNISNYEDPPQDNQPFLGLKHSDHEFDNYRKALAVLGKKFEQENDVIPDMVKFIRTNYQ